MITVKTSLHKFGDMYREQGLKDQLAATRALEKLDPVDQGCIIEGTHAYLRLVKEYERLRSELEELRKAPKNHDLRDQFARVALAGLLGDHAREGTWHEYATSAYRIADAMLEARQATTKNEEHA